MEISPKQLNKLKTAAKIVEKGDFAIIEKILEFEDFVEDLFEKYSENIQKIEDGIYKLEELKVEIKQYSDDKANSVSEVMSEHSKKMLNILNTLDDIKESFENKLHASETSYKEQMQETVKRLYKELDIIKTSIPVIKEEIEETPEEVRDKLEKLEGNERLDKSAIKGLDEELNKIKGIRGGGVSVFGGRQLRMESFSFSGNDVLTSFSLPKEPGAKGKAIWANYQGQHLQLGTHFTVTGRTFECVGFTPQTGSVIEGFIIL